MKKGKRRRWLGYIKQILKDYPDDVNEDEKRAVDAAIAETKTMKNGDLRLKIIDLMYLKERKGLQETALKVHYSYDRTKQFHDHFLGTVGKHFRCDGLK